SSPADRSHPCNRSRLRRDHHWRPSPVVGPSHFGCWSVTVKQDGWAGYKVRHNYWSPSLVLPRGSRDTRASRGVTGLYQGVQRSPTGVTTSSCVQADRPCSWMYCTALASSTVSILAPPSSSPA